MKSLGTVKLTVTNSESSFAIPASCIRLDFSNPSDVYVRFAFVTGKVAGGVLTIPPEYLVIDPCSYTSRIQAFGASDVLYYAGNELGAVFYVTPYIK